MRWSGSVSVALHAAALAWLALGWEMEPPAVAAPIEIALLPPAPPPPPPPAPPEPIRMPELKQPEPLPEPEPLELDEPPPELLAETPVALPKQRPKPPRKIEPKPEVVPEPAAAPPPAPQPPVQVASSSPAAPPRPAAPPPSYLAELVAELERYKDYPRSAQRRREQGTALLRFTLTRDGHVADWRIERSSGHESLDEAVAAMIRKADPLPPLPREIAGDRLDLVVPVSFVLR